MRMKKLIVTLGAAGLVAAAAAPASASPAASPMSAGPPAFGDYAETRQTAGVSSASVSSDCVPIVVERRGRDGVIYYEYEHVCF